MFTKAYRLEPLIYEHYSNIPPVRVTRVCAELEKPKHQTGGYLTHGSWLSALFKAGKEIELHVGDSIDIPSPKLNAEKQNESVRNCGVKSMDFLLAITYVKCNQWCSERRWRLRPKVNLPFLCAFFSI